MPVLIDPHVLSKTAADMMLEAGVSKCHIEEKFYSKLYEVIGETIEIVSYEKGNGFAQKLPTESI